MNTFLSSTNLVMLCCLRRLCCMHVFFVWYGRMSGKHLYHCSHWFRTILEGVVCYPYKRTQIAWFSVLLRRENCEFCERMVPMIQIKRSVKGFRGETSYLTFTIDAENIFRGHNSFFTYHRQSTIAVGLFARIVRQWLDAHFDFFWGVAHDRHTSSDMFEINSMDYAVDWVS